MTVNPYTRLKETATAFTKLLRNLKSRSVGQYNNGTTNINYEDLKTTIKIGQRLGYDVKLTIDEKTNVVTIYYADKIPSIPFLGSFNKVILDKFLIFDTMEPL